MSDNRPKLWGELTHTLDHGRSSLQLLVRLSLRGRFGMGQAERSPATPLPLAHLSAAEMVGDG